jgi:hypothetical protein
VEGCEVCECASSETSVLSILASSAAAPNGGPNGDFDNDTQPVHHCKQGIGQSYFSSAGAPCTQGHTTQSQLEIKQRPEKEQRQS